MRVRRVLIMEGDPEWIANTLKQSWVQPDQPQQVPNGKITEVERAEMRDWEDR